MKLSLAALVACAFAVPGVSFAETRFFKKDVETSFVHTLAADKYTTIQTRLITVKPEPYLKDAQTTLPAANKFIVEDLLGYPRNGTHKYWWPRKGESAYDGGTTDVIVNGFRAMKGEPKAQTFCCGLTLEVFYKAADRFKATSNFTSETLPLFKGLWFCEKIYSPGPTDALTAFGMGREIINHKDVLPGDFVQLWRNNKSGHSVIFINWVYKPETTEPAGFVYWSTQTSTNGINFNTELFGDYPRHMDRKKTAFVRFTPENADKTLDPSKILDKASKKN